jgi:hypothetical protein
VRVNGNPGLRVTAVIAGEFGNAPTGAPTGKKKAPRVAGLSRSGQSELMLSVFCEQFLPAQPTQSQAIRECPAQVRL